mmetsp:Transcript_18558/g.74087  ORF Transcript_18558/g.74087 Transcript_18558/m.74087 type:complete len:225 (-) Transcript_18558:15-689(-)
MGLRRAAGAPRRAARGQVGYGAFDGDARSARPHAERPEDGDVVARPPARPVAGVALRLRRRDPLRLPARDGRRPAGRGAHGTARVPGGARTRGRRPRRAKHQWLVGRGLRTARRRGVGRRAPTPRAARRAPRPRHAPTALLRRRRHAQIHLERRVPPGPQRRGHRALEPGPRPQAAKTTTTTTTATATTATVITRRVLPRSVSTRGHKLLWTAHLVGDSKKLYI